MLRALAAAVAVLVATPPTAAQWSTNPGAPLVLANRPTGQAQPKVSPFDYGGGYVSWLGGGGDGYDVYLQRLDGGGNPQWDASGIRVADRSYSSTQNYGLDAYPSGDAYLAFRRDVGGTAQVGARRIAPDGTSVWGDLVVSADPAGVNAPQVAAMPDDGAVVGWTSGDGALRLQRLDASGAPMWGADGIAVAPPSGTFFIGGLIGYPDGSVVVSGQAQLSFASRRLWAQKFDPSGAPLWGATPVEVFDGATGALQLGSFPAPTGDSNGGAVFVWYAVSGVAGAQSYVQHVRADGSSAFGQNGVAVASTPGRVRVSPAAVQAYTDTGPAIIVVWTEETPSPARQFGVGAQRISATGERLWGDGGQLIVPLGDAPISQVQLAWTAAPLAAVWATGAAPGPMTLSGALTDFDLNSFNTPFPVKTSPTSVSRLGAARSIRGGGLAAFAWADGDGGQSVQAQHINWSGLGPPTATPSIQTGPDALATLSVAPHPASGAATLHLSLVQPAAVRLEVLDALGRRVAVVTAGRLGGGAHALPWDTRGLAPGVYLMRLTVGTSRTARRVVVAR